MDFSSVSEGNNSATASQPLPECNSLALCQTLLRYPLEFPSTTQELERRILATCTHASTSEERAPHVYEDARSPTSAIYNTQRNILNQALVKDILFGRQRSKNDLRRISLQSALSHSYNSFLFRLLRQTALRKGCILPLNPIPSFVSNQRISFKLPHSHSEQLSGRASCGAASLLEPTMSTESIYARKVRRYVSELAIEKDAPNNRRKGFYASASAASGAWELELIEGLMFEDLDLNLHHGRNRSSRGWTQIEPVVSSQAPVKNLSSKQVVKIARVEPEAGNLKPVLEIKQVDMPTTLKVVQAIAVTGEVPDEISPVSDDGTVYFTDDETISPISDRCVREEPVSPTSSETLRLITFEDTPDIKLDSNNWPLPKTNGGPRCLSVPDSEPVPEHQYLCSVELNGHPHPLRSNPIDSPDIHKNPSSLATVPSQIRRVLQPTVHKKESKSSLASNRNRKAVIIQKNDSSLSLHSQGTVTDMSMSEMGNSWLVSSSASASASNHSLQDGRQFSGAGKLKPKLKLKSAIMARHTSPSPFTRHHGSKDGVTTIKTDESQTCQSQSRSRSRLRLFRRPSSALLTPVSETFEKLNTKRESADARHSVSTDSRRPSSFSIVSGNPDREGKRKRRRAMGFNGAMVGHSRKGGL